MGWQDYALAAAGLIGAVTAILHGLLVQRLMVGPIAAHLVEDRKVAGPVRRLVAPLLHFSTLAWLMGGLALIAASGLRGEARLATALIVGFLYLSGLVVNLWATRGRHPGWMLMAAALLLIALGLGAPAP